MQQPLDLSPNHGEGLPSLQYPNLDVSAHIGPSLHAEMENDNGMDEKSDSTYEIISQDSFHNSDDESNDNCSDSILSDTEDNHEEESVILHAKQQSVEKPVPELISESLESTIVEERLSTPSLSSSGYASTSSSAESYLGVSSHRVDFKESSSTLGYKNTKVSHTVQYGDRNGDYFTPTITINQTMSRELLKLDKSLHIVYSGSDLHKQDVIEKIAAAVAASLKISRDRESPYSKLQIVPLSLVGEDYPDAQVTTVPSTGLEIFVNDCTAYIPSKDASGKPENICFKRNLLYECNIEPHQNKMTVFSCQRPDLAVVLHSTTDCHAFSWAQSALLAHFGIPVIDLLEMAHPQDDLTDSSIGRPSTPEAVHMSVHMSTLRDTKVVKMPIDLSTFLSMDPQGLNRNLACLTGLRECSRRGLSNFVTIFLGIFQAWLIEVGVFVNKYAQWWNDCFGLNHSSSSGSVETWNVLPRLRSYQIPIAIVLSSMLMSAQIWSLLGQGTSIVDLSTANYSTFRNAPESVSVAIMTVTSTVFSTDSSSASVLTGTQVSRTHTEYLVSTVTKTIQQPTAARLIPASTLDFWLYKTDEGKLFLHSSKKLPRKWQPPKDWIEVSQGNNRSAAVYTKFNESTYELHMDLQGSCEPITIIVQPSKGQHAQKIFQIYDTDACKATKSWTAVVQDFGGWRLAMPVIPYISPMATFSKVWAAGDNARATIKHRASAMRNMTQAALERQVSALHDLSPWVKRPLYIKPLAETLPNAPKATTAPAEHGFKSLWNASVALSNFATQLSRSAGILNGRAKAQYHNTVSSYLRMQAATRDAVQGIIGKEIETVKKDLASTRVFLGTKIPMIYENLSIRNTSVINALNQKMAQGLPEKPLKTAKHRAILMTQKLGSLGIGLCKALNRVEVADAPTEKVSELVNQTTTSLPQDRSSVWSRFWRKD